MTLEQQVANLVTETTALTSVVNSELNSVRSENNTFKQSTLSSLDAVVANKVRGSGFTIYVNNQSGSANPVNPIDNSLAPFDTIARATSFLSSYKWDGTVVIKLSPGVHLVSGQIYLDKITSYIKIEGASTPVFSGVEAIVSLTTLANKDSNSSVIGSNSSLFDHLSAIYQSHIVTLSTNYAAFNVINSKLILSNCFVYCQEKQLNINIQGIGMVGWGSSDISINNCAFMYFRYGLIVKNQASFSLSGNCICSANVYPIGMAELARLYTDISSILRVSGNLYSGISSSSAITSIVSNCIASANGSHGFESSNGANITLWGCSAKNNGGYGFYITNAGIILSLGPDINNTGNVAGKKFENNAFQGYVLGVSAT